MYMTTTHCESIHKTLNITIQWMKHTALHGETWVCFVLYCFSFCSCFGEESTPSKTPNRCTKDWDLVRMGRVMMCTKFECVNVANNPKWDFTECTHTRVILHLWCRVKIWRHVSMSPEKVLKISTWKELEQYSSQNHWPHTNNSEAVTVAELEKVQKGIVLFSMRRTEGKKGDVSEAAIRRARTRLAVERAEGRSSTSINADAENIVKAKSETSVDQKKDRSSSPTRQEVECTMKQTKNSSLESNIVLGPFVSALARSGALSPQKLSQSPSHPSMVENDLISRRPMAEHGSLSSLPSLRSGTAGSDNRLTSKNSSLLGDEASDNNSTSPSIEDRTMLMGIKRRSMNPAIARVVSQDVLGISCVAPDVVLRQRELTRQRTIESVASRERWRKTLQNKADQEHNSSPEKWRSCMAGLISYLIKFYETKLPSMDCSHDETLKLRC